jgi:CBS-domain-containing membrane protein
LRRSGNDALPVLDAEGYLVGVLSFADLTKELPR